MCAQLKVQLVIQLKRQSNIENDRSKGQKSKGQCHGVVAQLPDSLMFVLASPVKSSKAASDTFRSVFHDEIRRWHTKYVARTNKA